MPAHRRDIILLVRKENMLAQNIDEEIGRLHRIIDTVETPDAFCRAHELVHRNHITQKKFTILNAIAEGQLRPFHFLINKN